jgi:hypothetical protein
MTNKNNKLKSFYKRKNLIDSSTIEKVSALKIKMKVLYTNCETVDEELEYLEYAFTEGI